MRGPAGMAFQLRPLTASSSQLQEGGLQDWVSFFHRKNSP